VAEPFSPFARRLTRSYVLLAVALIALVVTTTSVLAFLLYVGTLDEAIANDAQRAATQALVHERQGQPVQTYAAAVAGELAGSRVTVRVYDSNRQLLAQSGGSNTAPGRLTRAVGAIFGLHPAVVAVAGGTIVVAPDLHGFARLLQRYLVVVLPIGAVAVLAAWLLGRTITRRAIAPLQAVAAALRRIAAGDFSPQPLTSGESSLRELTAAYNEVAHRLTAATVERERNEMQMKQFIADAGHELRTPLTIVMGYLEVLQQGVVGDAAGVRHVYETMLAESRRMRASIEKLILLARLERPAPPRTEPVDVGSLARRAADELRPLAGERIELALEPVPCVAIADDRELYEAIANIVENAVRYAPQSPIGITVTCNGTLVELAVRDNGPGMETQDVEHAFDRFYRGGDRSVDGSGLGLAIAKRAVERIGGSIELRSSPGSGTTVTIALPRGS
jgi:signal transduction histidine kinase